MGLQHSPELFPVSAVRMADDEIKKHEDDIKKVRLALHNADERMYADKKKYYAEHPEKKIRRWEE